MTDEQQYKENERRSRPEEAGMNRMILLQQLLNIWIEMVDSPGGNRTSEWTQGYTEALEDVLDMVAYYIEGMQSEKEQEAQS